MHNGYQVTNAAGNLVDLNGNRSTERSSQPPGLPGLQPDGVAVARLPRRHAGGRHPGDLRLHLRHARQEGAAPPAAPRPATRSAPVTPATSPRCTATTMRSRRSSSASRPTASRRPTPMFVISAEENDQFAGANVGRAIQPTPAGCDGVTVACNYATGQIGELQANIKGLLSTTASSGTQFDVEPQGASIYVHGQPAANDPTVRQLERDTAAMTSNIPYSGVPNEHIVKYQAGALEQRVLHMQTNDPLRTPTYTIFPMPDYFFSTTGRTSRSTLASRTTTATTGRTSTSPGSGMVGPGVAVRGVDGPGPAGGNESHDPNSTHTVPQASTVGTWVEETDQRPTLLYLVGLTDDYPSDGHVITQALTSPSASLDAVAALAAGYDQINSSVGQFATDTLHRRHRRRWPPAAATDDTAFSAEQAALLAAGGRPRRGGRDDQGDALGRGRRPDAEPRRGRERTRAREGAAQTRSHARDAVTRASLQTPRPGGAEEAPGLGTLRSPSGRTSARASAPTCAAPSRHRRQVTAATRARPRAAPRSARGSASGARRRTRRPRPSGRRSRRLSNRRSSASIGSPVATLMISSRFETPGFSSRCVADLALGVGDRGLELLADRVRRVGDVDGSLLARERRRHLVRRLLEVHDPRRRSRG